MNCQYILKTSLLAISAYSICFGMKPEQFKQPKVKTFYAEHLWNKCDIATIQFGLDKGFPIDKQNQQGVTLLHGAVHYGKQDIVKYLLSQNASPNSRNNEGNTPLHIAAKLGHDAIVIELLKYGADKEARNQLGITPLNVASYYGHAKVVELLLQHGADKEARNQQGNTPLHVASYCGHAKVVELLLQHGADKEVRNQQGDTSLYVASYYGHAKVVELLLQHGADKEVRNQQGNTPLHVAAKKGHAKVVELLLQHGANKEARNQLGITPLYEASYYGHAKVVELLLQHGADKEARNQLGSTPLHVAVVQDNIRIVKILLSHNAEINSLFQYNNHNYTPLLLALNSSDHKMAGLLLDYGAQISNHPLTLAKVNQIQNNKCELRKALHSQDSFKKVKELLKQGAYADNAVQHLLNTKYRALLNAVDRGNVEAVKQLSQEGVSLALCDNNGNSLLHRAVLKEHIPMIEYLLSIGVDPDVYNQQGVTPVALAAQKKHLLNVFFKYCKDNIWQDEATHDAKRLKKG